MVSTTASKSTIPVIDFSLWTNATNQSQRLTVAKEIIQACRTVGFVYLINHGLSEDLINQAFATSKSLFDLNHEEKMQAPHPDGPEVHRGYSHPGLEKVSQYVGDDEQFAKQLRDVQDYKESYEVGSEENKQQPNVWLPERTLPNFRSFTTKFYWECSTVVQGILRAMAVGLDLDEDYFLQFHSGHNNQLRLLHYPPVPAAAIESSKLARMPAHSDWSSLTILFQDDCGGLEVEDPKHQGEFVPATPLEGACVVNVGDLMMRWTNDTLKSTLHRVTLPPLADRFDGEQRMTRARYSIPYFVAPDSDALISVLPTCIDKDSPAKYEPVTQGDYNRMRAKAHY